MTQGAKSFEISKLLVWDAYLKGKANRGSASIDGVSILEFEKNLKGNLYKIWNRLSSGSYLPLPVKLIEIPKAGGKTRPLGIPTLADRIAQMVVVLKLEPFIEPYFHSSMGIEKANQFMMPSWLPNSAAGSTGGCLTWTSVGFLTPSITVCS